MFNMRGFSANNSLFVDGVRDDGLVARDVYNLEQIEVFSGPTGSDVGRTNAAGYINLTTKTPNLEARRRPARSATAPASRSGRPSTSISRLPIRRARHVPGQRRRARQRALAGRRHRRPRLRQPREQVDRPVDRLRPQHADAREPGGPDHASGQPRRLRSARRRVSDRAAGRRRRRRPRRRSIRRTTTAAPTTTTTRSGRTTSRCASSTTSRPALTAAQPDALQHRRRARRSSRASRNAAAYNPATNLVTLSRQANERHNEIFSNQTNLSARVRRPARCGTSSASAWRSRARASSRRRSAASARARRSISTIPTSSARSST